MLSPLLFLAALELALRGVGFGGSHPLFVNADEVPGHLHANPEVMRRYFPSRAPKLSPETIYFAQRKPADGYRIVVQGGSTAAGFPFGRWAGLAGMLGDRLEATFPEREIEVISTAMASVNSYTLLDFADEIVGIEPDAVLIYAGHNEYMGLFGVGSGLTKQRSRRATLLHLELRRYRAYQLFQLFVASGRELLSGASASPEPQTLMKRAATGAQIEYGSDPYRAGAQQFEANLEALLARYREADIRVYIGTLVSNEKDRAPFSGDGEDPDAADAWYARGLRELDAGNTEAARQAFRQARDRDRLPFRAPSSFEEVIVRTAQRQGAIVVDVARRFAEASPDGIVGNELMLEHVHPNAQGYFLLADAFYEALRVNGEIGDWSRAPSRDQAERDMPITVVDRLLAEHAVRELEADFPFSETRREVAFPEPRNEFERLAGSRYSEEVDWIDTMERLLQIHREAGRLADAAVVARMAAQAYPTERATNFTTGMLYLQLGRFARARRYLEESLRAAPGDGPTLRALARIDRLEARP